MLNKRFLYLILFLFFNSSAFTFAQSKRYPTHQLVNVKNKFMLDVNTAVTNRLGSQDNRSHFTKKVSETIKTGTLFSLACFYSLKKNMSVGLKYAHTYYNGSHNNTSFSFNDGRPTEQGNLNIRTNMNYFAIASFHHFLFGNDKNEMYFQPSIGYFLYHQKTSIQTPFNVKGGNLGFTAKIGYLRNITQRLSIGLNIELFNANLENYTTDDGLNKTKIKASRNDALNLSSINTGVNVSYKL